MNKQSQKNQDVENTMYMLEQLFPDQFKDAEFKAGIQQSLEHLFAKGYNCCSHIVKNAVECVIDNF